MPRKKFICDKPTFSSLNPTIAFCFPKTEDSAMQELFDTKIVGNPRVGKSATLPRMPSTFVAAGRPVRDLHPLPRCIFTALGQANSLHFALVAPSASRPGQAPDGAPTKARQRKAPGHCRVSLATRLARMRLPRLLNRAGNAKGGEKSMHCDNIQFRMPFNCRPQRYPPGSDRIQHPQQISPARVSQC